MLNEIGEFEQYTAPLDGKTPFENHRLKYFTLIKKNFAGLERAMTIIARKLIFGDSDCPKLDVADVKKCLRAWCGFKKETHPLVQPGWLPDFIKQQYPTATEALVALSYKENHFENSVFDFEENNFRSITYDRIIANALLRGKLKRYYLLTGQSSPFEGVTFEGKKLNKSKSELALKLTAFYLLQSLLSDQKWMTFNKLNFMNWLSAKRSDPDKWKLEQFFFCADEKPEALFEICTVIVRNAKVAKLRVNQNWIANFRLVEEAELNNPENAGRIFFSDSGGTAPLEENLCCK